MSQRKKFRLFPFLLVLLPLWLVGSGLYALVRYFKKEEAAAVLDAQRFSQTVSATAIADDMRKLVEVIGERNTNTPERLSATAAMLQGLLGPSNIGYEVRLLAGPAEFPVLQITLPSLKSAAAPVWVITSYDSPAGSQGAEKNASGVTATVAAAQALASTRPERPVHFLFLPHANEADAPLVETALIAARLVQAAPAPRAVLCVEAMGAAETLVLSSRDTGALPEGAFAGLGEILGAEGVCLGDDFELSGTLFQMNLPALRVATRPTLLPGEKDDRVSFAPTLAASTGRLIEFVNRLAR
jgi:hypothetical protein